MPTLLQRIPRNAALLVCLLIMIVLSPAIGEHLSGFVFELMFDGILFAGVYSIGFGGRRWPFLILTVVALATRWGQHLSGVPALDVGALFVTVLWLFYAIALIVGHLFQRRDVSVDTILASVVIYLLIAVAFTLTFEIIELRNPGSFSGLPDTAATNRGDLGGAMMYFSLVCISTMGYGDIAPLSDIARPVAVLEGVTGQLYLAVMIARLVGLHIAGGRDD